MVFFGLVGAVGDVGFELACDVFFIDPDVCDLGIFHQGVLSDDCRSDLIGPIDFINSMFIGKSKQNFIGQIVRIDTESVEPTVRSVSALNDNVLTGSNVKTDNTFMVVQNIQVTQIFSKICDRELILMQE